MPHDDTPPLRIAVTGASGLLGTRLCALLTDAGHRVDRLVRRDPQGTDIAWNPARGELDAAALEGVDAVIHLAGENVGARWTPERKRAIIESREKGTRLLCETVAGLGRPPKVLLSASATGYYGDRGDAMIDESAGPGTGFLAEVCQRWEAATRPSVDAGIRTVRMRLGVVLSAEGGALARMLGPFRMGVGGPIGGGRQYFSWIALDDVIGAIHHLLRAERVRGPVNLTAPNPVTQAAFARTLGEVLHRPAVLPLPAFAVRALFGEMGREVLLQGQRVVPAALIASGYSFLRPDLEDALRFELGLTPPNQG